MNRAAVHQLHTQMQELPCNIINKTANNKIDRIGAPREIISRAIDRPALSLTRRTNNGTLVTTSVSDNTHTALCVRGSFSRA